MVPVDELTRRLRAQGLRVTPQRRAIFELLQGDQSHPTVEDLYRAAQVGMPTISLKTVYQTVHELHAMGEVHLLHLGTGSVRVDPNVERPHHHLVCRACGRVRDVFVPVAAPALSSEDRQGFDVTDVDVHFRGLCAVCSGAEPPPAAP